jgi:hypothetical protein
MSATIDDLIDNDIDMTVGDGFAARIRQDDPNAYRGLCRFMRTHLFYLDNSAEGAD